MGRLGFEPRTNRLKAEYSTVELATLIDFKDCLLVSTNINHSTTFPEKILIIKLNFF